MKRPNNLNFENAKIPAGLAEKIDDIKTIMSESSDLLVNEIIISGHKSALICCEGMISTSTLTELVFHPLMYLDLGANSKPEDIFTQIQTKMLLTLDRVLVEEYGTFMQRVMSGFALVIVDGVEGAIALGVQGYGTRSISEPSGEANIKGSRDGFVETIRTNMSLIRRRIKSPTLKFELSKLGSRSKTDICLAYLTDKVPPKMLKEIKEKIKGIELETILSSGYVEPFLEPAQNSMFQEIGTTEKPDIVCAKILEGRIALLIDGTPFVLIIPYLFIENFQTLDDYNSSPYYAAFIRWIKYFAFIMAILLPGVYVAIAVFHPEMLNKVLLLNLESAEQYAPLPLLLETLVILLIYEIIREAGLRLPKPVGGAVSIVGGIIIGDTAVATGIISTPMLMAVALAITASFVVPNLNQPITILRLMFILAGGTMGLYGIGLVLAGVLVNICSMENFGIPYMAPVTPFTLKGMRDVITRVGFKKMQHGNVVIEDLNGAKKGG